MVLLKDVLVTVVESAVLHVAPKTSIGVQLSLDLVAVKVICIHAMTTEQEERGKSPVILTLQHSHFGPKCPSPPAVATSCKQPK